MSEIVSMCRKWWYDSSFYKNTGMKFEPDYDLFRGMSDSNTLFIIKGCLPNGEMVACYVAAISPYMFNTKYTMASEIVWSIDERYRKGREVFRLLTAIETGLKNSGISMYNLNLPIEEGKRSLSDYLVKKKGFFTQDISIIKEIK